MICSCLYYQSYAKTKQEVNSLLGTFIIFESRYSNILVRHKICIGMNNILYLNEGIRSMFLLLLLIILISIDSNMLSYNNSLKPRPKTNAELTAQYFSSYQPENTRKSATNNQPTIRTQLPQRKEKTYRKVNTQYNEQEPALDNNKYFGKGLRLTSKGGSPAVKKTIMMTETSPNSKLCFSNNAGKIKRVKKPTFGEKAITETGPIIQRFHNFESQKNPYEKEKEKVVFIVPEERGFLESRKENYLAKKIPQTKCANNNLYMKARLHTEGTMDTTPPNITSHDIDLTEIIGQGTFGKVYKGVMRKTGETVAVKKVYQDPKYKNREVEIVNMLKGDFVMKVLGSYSTIQQGGQFLNIVMAYYEGDLFNMIKTNGKKGLSTLDIKIISYQIFRGLLFIHHLKIAHRDIKPHNILYKGKKVAICDFGSAKIITNEPNLPYICSRCYRAPQLIFGATHYSTMIDIWSVGCVLLQMIQGSPLFIGESSIDHLIEIIKVLGTPTKSQVIDMNPNYDLNDYKFPKVKKREWNKIFPKADPLLLDFLSQILIYSPKQRLNAAQALAHQFYDELREESVYRTIQKQHNLNLFSFHPDELNGHEHLISKLIPTWHHQPRPLHVLF